jgi:hypothetical protein
MYQIVMEEISLLHTEEDDAEFAKFVVISLSVIK